VGIGINVTTTRDELPVATATSLVLEGAASVDRTRLLGDLLARFTHRYDGWVAAAGDGLRSSYSSACSTLGRRVRVALPAGQTLDGVAVGVDDDGRLVVDDGHRRRALGAGDVLHVRGGGTGRPA
jgi:BirA family biotin operon repressor/biotin-[acetyl-CoA-carboxylase] ligase